MTDTETGEKEFWLFGYGSLIWKPPPHYDRKIPGYVTGYVRRFWQASEDHRGTPDAPGRVVTLISHSFWSTLRDPHPLQTDKVWGAAYRIEASHVSEVKEYLDIREINGYTIHETNFYRADAPYVNGQEDSTKMDPLHDLEGTEPIKTIVYIGTPENAQFVGPQDPQELAEHIYKSVGPSGMNREYLLELETALEGLSVESGDEHIKDLANRVRGIEAREKAKGKDLEKEQVKALETVNVSYAVLNKVNSADEQEEIEN